MPDKFQNKYSIQSDRLQHWDYGSNAMYFITICTKNREHFFGEIEYPLIQLSEIGKLVETEWLKTFEMRPDMNLGMGNYVVMPNHFHAIISIGPNEYNMHRRDAMYPGDARHGVSTDSNHFGPQSKNLASIIRGFKSAITISAHKIEADFAWQPGFYDHIIRNNQSINRISNYIINNPVNWQNDKYR